MQLKSIMFPASHADMRKTLTEEPSYFKDLNLDQIIKTIIGENEYLKSYFYVPLHNTDIIQYRHEVMHDLESDELLKIIKTFTNNIQYAVMSIGSICKNLSQSDIYSCNYVEKGKLVDAAKIYCEEINCFAHDLVSFKLKSRGLLEFRKYILDYSESDYFISLSSETSSLKKDLSKVKYLMLIKRNCIKVRKYENQTDYCSEIEEVFKKFQQGDVKDYRKNLSEEPYAEYVEAKVLDMVSKLYPDVFLTLDKFVDKYKNFLDDTIVAFTQDVQFYIVYLKYMSKFKKAGLKFCYPKMLSESKNIYNYKGYDLALADKLIKHNMPVICNDFYLKDNERIIVVSGPNQGGKTTFARAFGQVHYLASLGCPVPGKESQLFLFDRIFTHFEKEENIKTLNGKLKDELVRMKYILSHATSNSIIIMNEMLSSTSLKDAISIGKKIIEPITEMDSLCVCVTFIDEIASLNEKIVSMVSTVVPENPMCRTFKIIRKPADGLAYAMDIAKKYSVTYECLKERIKE